MNALGNIGIDLTSLVLYIVNFGIIVFFVGKYLTGPLVEMLEKRRTQIQTNITEAETLKNEMSKQKMLIDSEKEASEKRLSELESNLKNQNMKQVSELLKQAEEKSSEIISKANELAEKKKTEIMSDVQKDIKQTVKKMVTYIVSNKIPDDVISESVNEAWGKSLRNKK